MKTEAEWRAEKEFKRDEAERKRAAAADPKEERRWRETVTPAHKQYRQKTSMQKTTGATEQAIPSARDSEVRR
jgi:hypothetical protein